MERGAARVSLTINQPYRPTIQRDLHGNWFVYLRGAQIGGPFRSFRDARRAADQR